MLSPFLAEPEYVMSVSCVQEMSHISCGPTARSYPDPVFCSQAVPKDERPQRQQRPGLFLHHQALLEGKVSEPRLTVPPTLSYSVSISLFFLSLSFLLLSVFSQRTFVFLPFPVVLGFLWWRCCPLFFFFLILDTARVWFPIS